MKGPREYRRIINRYRKRAARRGKRNGSFGCIDDPGLENLLTNSKRRYDRTTALRPMKEDR